jgi:uncharacterized cofD-like protein
LFLNPASAEAHPDAVRAILDADLVVIGPGSLYTSVLPNLLVDGIKKALAATSAMRVFVCNVATQHGETDGFSVRDHLEALQRHTGKDLVHAVVANSNIVTELPEAWHSTAVPLGKNGWDGVQLVQADVVAEENRYRHDPEKLAATLLRVYYGRDITFATGARQPGEAALLVTR